MQDKVKSESMDQAIKLMQLGGLVRQAIKLVRQCLQNFIPTYLAGLSSHSARDTDTGPFVDFHDVNIIS